MLRHWVLFVTWGAPTLFMMFIATWIWMGGLTAGLVIGSLIYLFAAYFQSKTTFELLPYALRFVNPSYNEYAIGESIEPDFFIFVERVLGLRPWPEDEDETSDMTGEEGKESTQVDDETGSDVTITIDEEDDQIEIWTL